MYRLCRLAIAVRRRGNRIGRPECSRCLSQLLCLRSFPLTEVLLTLLLFMLRLLRRFVSLLVEIYLRIEPRLALLRLNMVVVTVAVLFTRLHVITEHRLEYFDCAVCYALIQQRSRNLNAALGISCHEVGAGDVHPAAVAGAENVDTAVLQESSHDGNYTYILSVPLDACDKAADTPDYQLDFDPGAACLGEILWRKQSRNIPYRSGSSS